MNKYYYYPVHRECDENIIKYVKMCQMCLESVQKCSEVRILAQISEYTVCGPESVEK